MVSIILYRDDREKFLRQNGNVEVCFVIVLVISPLLQNQMQNEKWTEKIALAIGRVFLCHANISRMDVSNRSIDSTISIQSDKGDSPPTVAMHRWVATTPTGWMGRGEEGRDGGGRESAPGRVLWTRSIMHLLAGVVPLSHRRRVIASARRSFSF